MFSLSKYLGSLAKGEKSIAFNESKLAKALHGIVDNHEKTCSVVFLAHLYPVEQNYEESVLTLQYLDRLKAYDANYRKVIFDGPIPEQVEA